MRIVIAPDSFKECAPASEVAEAIASGIRRAFPAADLVLAPMADGGEGTVDAMVAATGGETVELEVTGPLGEPVTAKYGLLHDGETAVIEMAAASGLSLVPPDKRDPRITTTYGAGELMRDALDRGVERMVLGIGGSATNDGGAGMAQALGYRLRTSRLEDVAPGGAALVDLARIDPSQRHPRLDTCEVLVACDVANPLCGPSGASQVYGPQKGASPEVAAELDAALERFGKAVDDQLGVQILDLPGAGAAGGLGGGLVAFAGGELRSGIELIAQTCGLYDKMVDTDLVITGEGCLDAQTANGKAPVGVAEIAKRDGIPVVALAGVLGEGYQSVFPMGIDAAFSICPGPISREESIARWDEFIADVAESVVYLWFSARQ